MSSFDYDLRYLRAGIENLESYLLSDHLYWTMNLRAKVGEPTFPSLTLGNLLLVQARLKAWPKTLQQEAQLGALIPEMEQLRGRWSVAWRQKAEHSLASRIQLWRNYLDEYQRMPDANADRYAYEVMRRVMIDLLQPEADQIPQAVISLISKLDTLLKSFLVPGRFIWNVELSRGFPKKRYWYLYGDLPDEL